VALIAGIPLWETSPGLTFPSQSTRIHGWRADWRSRPGALALALGRERRQTYRPK